jgi:hypothetical protein
VEDTVLVAGDIPRTAAVRIPAGDILVVPDDTVLERVVLERVVLERVVVAAEPDGFYRGSLYLDRKKSCMAEAGASHPSLSISMDTEPHTIWMFPLRSLFL